MKSILKSVEGHYDDAFKLILYLTKSGVNFSTDSKGVFTIYYNDEYMLIKITEFIVREELVIADEYGTLINDN